MNVVRGRYPPSRVAVRNLLGPAHDRLPKLVPREPGDHQRRSNPEGESALQGTWKALRALCGKMRLDMKAQTLAPNPGISRPVCCSHSVQHSSIHHLCPTTSGLPIPVVPSKTRMLDSRVANDIIHWVDMSITGSSNALVIASGRRDKGIRTGQRFGLYQLPLAVPLPSFPSLPATNPNFSHTTTPALIPSPF